MSSRGGKPTLFGGPFVTGGGAAWTPRLLSPLHWLDANDAATISLSGSNVTAWSDKGSAAGSWAQATASKRPTYSASDLGYPGVRFNGTNVQRLTVAMSSIPAAMQLVTVLRLDFDPVVGSNIGIWDLGTSALLATLANSGSNSDNFGSTARKEATFHSTDFAAANVVYSAVSKSSYWANYENYTLRYSTLTNTVDLPATLAVGASADLYGMSGVFREILIFPSELSASDLTSLRTYLTAKWGTP